MLGLLSSVACVEDHGKIQTLLGKNREWDLLKAKSGKADTQTDLSIGYFYDLTKEQLILSNGTHICVASYKEDTLYIERFKIIIKIGQKNVTSEESKIIPKEIAEEDSLFKFLIENPLDCKFNTSTSYSFSYILLLLLLYSIEK